MSGQDLLYASGDGDLEKVKYLLQEGVSIDSQNSHGNTALRYAAEYGKLEMIRFLIRAGADVNIQDKHGCTVLMCILMYVLPDNQLDKNEQQLFALTVKILIDAGTNIELRDDDGQTALMLATHNNKLEAVRLLLQAGPKLDVQNYFGETALILAAKYNRLKILRELLKAGADISTQDKNKDTALIYAAFNKNPEAVQALINKGIKREINDPQFNLKSHINLQDEWKLTALMMAAGQFGDTKIVRILLEAGADINIQNKKGKTAYELSWDENIKNLITEHQIIRENIRKLEDLRVAGFTYFSIVPYDLIFLIKNELKQESMGSI